MTRPAGSRAMEHHMKKIIIIAVVVAALVGGWFYGSPWWTLHQMRSAAEARDADKLARYVDFPALREDLKADMSAMMVSEMEKNPQGGIGAIGATFAMAMIGPMVDGMITPQAIEAMFKSQAAKEAAQPKRPGKADLEEAGPGVDPDIERVSFDEFRAKGKGKDGAVIFKRHGLGWKMSGLDIPLR